jgi:hypothetical protein
MPLPAVLLAAAVAAPPVDYNRDVRPILSNHCFKCHGPATQKGKLRLDAKHFATRSGAVVPGKPGESELVNRVTAADEGERMPPAGAAPPLSPQQIDTLRRWVAAGADYAPHWAFVPPKRPVPPAEGHPVDAFIEARLKAAGITPSPEADRPTLIRRATLDLIGLLPTPAEVEAFEADRSPDAYERVIDRLLASPHYGERQARHWLDLARYADSNGYTIDGPRTVWPWRDWVVTALNADMPFDRFTVEQLAGDLLPNATKEQQIATGFHRNTAYNEEGGTDPEQFRVERTIDRTNTTGAAWLGLTVGCCQCHDHKYDPVPQKDYYRLYAFFNSCDEPTLPVGGSAELTKKVNELTARAAALKTAGKTDDAVKVEKEIKKVAGGVPTTLVMRERKEPRKTHVQIRGDFLRPGDEVTPGYPAAIAATPAGKLTRLDLARWLVSADNPLTARVAVNRYWQQFFGRGLVETENDFGMQGSLPTHPELLDWLATEFMAPRFAATRGGPPPQPWSVKHIHRVIVTSAAYKRSSAARPDLRSTDPRNLLLARQSRLRLEAEAVRDAALSASGLLTPRLGGPPVYPPQPREVFAFTQSSGRAWPESTGPDRYRRGLYTYIWRQSQHPLLTTFDGADAQTACTRRNRTNTPLQALHLANDPVFVELADGLGKRVVKDGPADDAGRVRFAFRLCVGRLPTSAEADRVTKYLASAGGPPEKTWAAVGRVLLNLDEFITRE